MNGTYTTRSVTLQSTLGPLDQEILASIPTAGVEAVHAFLVWVDQEGQVQFGPCRYREVWDNTVSFSVSPFPGAWTSIDASQILAVRSPEALIDDGTARRVADRPPWWAASQAG